MATPGVERRACPTREEGEPALIVHWIGVSKCQGRQREHYHKCHTCVFRNDTSARRRGSLVAAGEGKRS